MSRTKATLRKLTGAMIAAVLVGCQSVAHPTPPAAPTAASSPASPQPPTTPSPPMPESTPSQPTKPVFHTKPLMLDLDFDRKLDQVYWEDGRLTIVLASGEVAVQRDFRGAPSAQVTDIVRAYQLPLSTLVLHVAVPTCEDGGGENLFVWSSGQTKTIHTLDPGLHCARYEYLGEDKFALTIEGDPVVHGVYWSGGDFTPASWLDSTLDRRLPDAHLDAALTALSKSPGQETSAFQDAATLEEFRAKAGGKGWTFIREPGLGMGAAFRIESEGRTIGELTATLTLDGVSSLPRIGELHWQLPDYVITYELLPGNGWRLSPDPPVVHVGESFRLLRIGYSMNERLLTTSADVDHIISYDSQRFQDGALFHAKAPGDVAFSIIPYYGDWDVKKEFVLKVEP